MWSLTEGLMQKCIKLRHKLILVAVITQVLVERLSVSGLTFVIPNMGTKVSTVLLESQFTVNVLH